MTRHATTLQLQLDLSRECHVTIALHSRLLLGFWLLLMAHIGRSSEAVESYLRNFSDGEINCQEILEITLCYGLQCLSKTFPIRGRSITCSELRIITGQCVQSITFCRRAASADPLLLRWDIVSSRPIPLESKETIYIKSLSLYT